MSRLKTLRSSILAAKTPQNRGFTRSQQVEDRLSEVPKVYRTVYRRALAGKGRRYAVKAFCLQCCNWQREEVKLCPSVACPLFAVRPYQEKQESDNV